MTNYLPAIYRGMSSALSLDDQRRYREAYHKYLDVMESTVHLLRAVETGSEQVPVEQVSNLVKYTDECLKRVDTIYRQHIINNSNTSAGNTSSASNSNSSSPSSIVSSPVTSPSNQQFSNTQQSGVSGRTFQPFELYYSQKIIHQHQQQQQQQSVRKPHDTKAAARRMAEEMALQRMKQQMDYQKQIAMRNQSVQQFERTLQTNCRRFKWRSQDKYTKFLDQYFDYLKMDADLLHEDSQWLQSLADQVKYKLLNQSDQNAPSLEDVVTKSVKEHFRTIAGKPGHAITQLLANFSTNFSQTYNQSPYEFHSDYRTETTKEMIAKAVTDLNTFVEKLVQALFGKYWTDTMNDICERMPDCEKVVVNCINEHLLSTGIYPKLISLYHTVNHENDDLLTDKVYQLKSAKLYHYQIRNKFRLDEDESGSPYRDAIDKFIEFDTHHFLAQDKVECLMQCLKEINLCVSRYWSRLGKYDADDLALGADDLLPLFCYVLVKSQVNNLYSKFNYLSDFIDDNLLLGERGYVLATLETAMNYLLTVQVDSFFDVPSPSLSTTDGQKTQPPAYKDQVLYTVQTEPRVVLTSFVNDYEHVNQFQCVPPNNYTTSRAGVTNNKQSLEIPDDIIGQALSEDEFSDLF